MLYICFKCVMYVFVNLCNSFYSILYFFLVCINFILFFFLKYYFVDIVYEENFLILYLFIEENICFKVNDFNLKKIEFEEN